MSGEPGAVVRHLRRLALLEGPEAANDGQLLTRFLSLGDEAAFDLLVRRHGPMVLATCRRVLRGHADAEDAFQAVFLVLARKAAGLTGCQTIGGWMHAVAYRTARKARAALLRRRTKEAVAARPAHEDGPDHEQSELLGLLDRELARLPDRYRQPVVLCELEGVPRRQAAGLLGIPEGTLSSRLATARKMLARRLRLRGALPAALAPLPAPLARAAVQVASAAAGHGGGPVSAAVLNLSREGARTMILTRAALAGLVVLVSLLAAGQAGWRQRPPEVKALAPAPQAIPDGVYWLNFEGKGRSIRLGNGSRAFLGDRVSRSVGTDAALRSLSNDNTRFALTIKKLGPLPPEVTETQTALVVDGVILHLGRPEKLADDRTTSSWATVYSAEAARKLAAHYKIEPARRKHPGHRFSTRWVPGKAAYAPGEAVTLKLELRNTGTVPMRFTIGGKQRGPRDNQYRFLAYAGHGGGKAVPDTGDPLNFGGISTSKTLKPGDVYRAEVALDKWFRFTEPDVYRVTGMLELSLSDPEAEDPFGPVIWDDLAVGDCLVRVEKPK
jgi:RNA polymerase sigma factor (sigma-70 family)